MVPLDGVGSWAYKPRGEIAGDAVREVGVTRGTDEPGNNRNLGTVVFRAAAGGDPQGRRPGEGVTVGMAKPEEVTGE